ncbi:MAG: hypothetical protein CSA26_06510 [Desulfobacterales bacterium]|nr:MAG: hypothetical protein CSA26_06510 [Desulfobacterales bacterium]
MVVGNVLLKVSLKSDGKDIGNATVSLADDERLAPESENPDCTREYTTRKSTDVVVRGTPVKKSRIRETGQEDKYGDLKQWIHMRLLDLMDLRRLDLKGIDDDTLRGRCEQIVRKIIADLKNDFPGNIDKDEITKDILDEALSLGPLEDLVADDRVSEIMVISHDKIYIERDGMIQLSPKRFSSDASVLNIIQRIINPIGRRIDESSPLVDARLADGSRVNAIIPPLALNGPCITIRKFSSTPITADNLVKFGSLTRGMMDFIRLCVENNKNIIISGGTGSGKTTLLNIFSSFIHSNERIITIEDAAELQLRHEHIVRLESRPPNIEGKGDIPIQKLVKNALRMRPDRIIIGECRSGEALDMLQAMNTGHDGSMTTGHANSPKDILSRLETMVMMAGQDLPSRAIREQIGAAVDIIVQQKRFACGARKITDISEVVGIDDGEIQLKQIFYFREDGKDRQGKTFGKFIATGWIPDFITGMQQRGVRVDMSVFHNV